MGLKGFRLRHPLRWALGALALLALLAAHDGWRWWQAARLNAALAGGHLPPGDDDRAPVELRFARAHALAASAAGPGDIEAALARYGALQSDPQLGPDARYNAAQLLLTQALVLRERQQPGQALALVELAKEQYREVLRTDPEAWDARYNLERAQRLVPDPEPDDEEAPPARQAERAATTMRAYSPGLP